MTRKRKQLDIKNIQRKESLFMVKSRPPSLMIIIIANLILLAFLFIVIFSLPLPLLFVCTSPIAQSLILATSMVFILHFFSGAISSLGVKGIGINPPKFFKIIGTELLVRKYILSVTVFIAIVVTSSWLGSYTYSPFYIQTVQIPVIRGFLIITSDNKTLSLLPGDEFGMKTTAWASISVVTEPPNVECQWLSSNGSSIDNFKKCSIVYFPALGLDVDLLQVQISPACQTPESHGHLKVKITP